MASFPTRSFLTLSGTLSLVAAANAQQSFSPQQFSPFASPTAMPETGPVSQRQFAEAATTQFSFLSSLRDWRDTMRGTGKFARREFKPKQFGKNFGFAVGSVSAPIVGGGSGLLASYKAFEIGTTAQPQDVTELLNSFDAMMTGDKKAITDPTQMSWMRMRPIQSDTTQLEVSMSRGRRDLQGGKGEMWMDGSFQNARLNMKLPARWSMASEYTREKLGNQEETQDAWNVNAQGPINHPFGVAEAKVNISDVSAGYATLNDPNPVDGQKKGEMEVAQGVAIGPLSGNLKVAANKRERAEDDATIGEEIKGGGARSQADMRLRLTPNLALISSGSAQFENVTRALKDQQAGAAVLDAIPVDGEENNPNELVTSPDLLLTPSQSRELTQQYAGDVGVEWKFSKAFSMAVSTGTTRGSARRNAGQLWEDTPGSEEDRRAIELRHKTSGSDFRVRLAQRSRRSVLGSTSTGQSDISQWRVEAARRLIGSVHLKTIVDMASDDDTNQEWRRYEAQVQLARAARFDARYRDGSLTPGLLGDDWSSTFAAPDGNAKQWSGRFNVGSAATGNGFGMALEYARIAGTRDDQWRIGIQFK